ncbi:type VI secretion system contractile sheath large subunit [Catenovulum sp. SM1970]|uniref:type VI secretion system contractile sheath large subunit n=1 Tax=Marinifaba aquimaris TaxID=2741323 RepID=UPI00157383E0|nr:type VI secretion system contractile sheath large subunit [Marinifaba aquimaris]NTS75655.1 type VI secretion system contractile sheath large subunit [Marinifaba aquimaris]
MAEELLEGGQEGAVEELDAGSFASLLQKEFKPKSDRAADEVEKAFNTLAGYALEDANVISEDTVHSIESIIAKIDEKLSEQVNEILHHEDFQQLEGTWRGLHYLVNNTETDETLKIRAFNITKKELAKNLKKFAGTAWDQSPIFKKFYEEEYGQFGGEPLGAIVGDYYFDNSPADVNLLSNMSKICAASHSPFISAAGPSLLQMDSWSELANPRDLTKVFSTPDYASFRSLRETDDAKYISLTMPRVLSRLPYGADTEPCEAFNFEEDTSGADSSKYTWANAAYSMAVNINRSFKEYGWCSRIRGIESGGDVQGLPVHAFPSDDGGVDMKCPTEVAISDRREAELSACGIMPLIHRKNSDMAAFIGAQTLQKPAEYDDPDATANAALSARLPYLFATCRFAHYLKCMVRDKVGSFKSRDDMSRWLNEWINNYVDGDPDNSTEETKARRPLAAAEVAVDEVEGSPGYYSAKFYLRPHYQLEGLTASLRLVSKLPSEKA